MIRRGALLALPVLVAVGAIAVAATLLLREGDGPAGGREAPLAAQLDRCGAAFDDESKRSCFAAALKRLVAPASDPRDVVQRISTVAWAERGGFLLPNCHGLMHTVGREYALAHRVELATLMDYLPRSNDPGCSAGFAHGLVSAVAPQIDPSQPRAATAVCTRAATRYQRYSCIHGFGHAFMRVYNEQLAPALELCRALGHVDASDCAQGAFHDYWFSVSGLDGTTSFEPKPELDPRALCAQQPKDLVPPCWYRAFVDTRPHGFQTRTPADFDGLCEGLAALQRDACITAASVIGPPDPVEQLRLCAKLGGADAVSCIHGTKVQNLLGSPTATYVRVIRGCARFSGATRDACYTWLGKTLSVVTDGRFRRAGCTALAAAARRACIAGARTMNGPLVTFS